MRSLLKSAVLALLALSASNIIAKNDSGKHNLENIFRNPQEVVETSCYWYWISGNISKEGIVNDLKAMKQAGINRAYIGNIGLPPNEAPTGDIKIMSPKWWDIMRTALKTASDLNIEIGIFNSPGWSQAGGPWNTPEESMKYLATQSKDVKGGKININFEMEINDINKTVKVLAYPLPEDYMVLSTENSNISPNARELFDGNQSTTLAVPSSNYSITITSKNKHFIARSLRILPDSKPILGKLKILVKNGNKWNTIREVVIDRTNFSTDVGYDVFAPFGITLPNVKGKVFQLVFENMNSGCGIREIEISSAPIVEKYAEKILSKMYQAPLPYWNEYKWYSDTINNNHSAIKEKDIVDLTSQFKNNKLSCTLPKGMWRIVRTYMLPTGICNAPALADGRGLEVDRWNKSDLKHHYNSFIGRIRDSIPVEDRKTWKVVVCDSYEKATQNFGDDFIKGFKAAYGYDPTPFLLTYNGTVVGNEEKSNRFLWDVRRMIANRLAYDHIGGLRKLAHNDGFKLWLENYGHWGFPGEFLQYGGQADDIAGEFWSEGTLGDIENRAASSCGHIYGKQKVYAESFTCGGKAFARYPSLMKQRGDRFFTEGINSTLLHLVISQPDETTFPGLNAPFGNEFNRKNTWYRQLHQFTDYLKRCNYMLQQGNYVADVAYFIGEDSPVMTGICSPSLPKGYQYDYINAEVIEKSLAVDSLHNLTLPHGTQYKLLVLPPINTIRPELLRKIRTLVYDGAIVLGPKPLKSPSLQNYPKCDEEIKVMADELWGENSKGKIMRKIGKGYIFKDYDIADLFKMIDVTPDFMPQNDSLLYAHTTQSGKDIYYITNQSNDTIQFDAQFRIDNRLPQLWNPINGNIKDINSFVSLNKSTTIPMKLYPLESTFIVFEKNIPASVSQYISFEKNYPKQVCMQSLNSNWTLNLKDMFGNTQKETDWTLSSWSINQNDEIKYFSGEGIYTNSFKIKEIKKTQKYYLDLGEVGVIAQVKINGKNVGGVWAPPYQLEISDVIKTGINDIEITVDNTWVNRLIGDLNKDVTQRQTSCPNNPYSVNSPLQLSGLMGPVKILMERK
ncbi:glycosyl hydrolase [uncultured Bacteroides sp.]|uniref:glycosyl hydrolase n=1 Tax=uncultured Bacteroides sp. TaxID=162156 RepID=UPI002AAC4397|nr:glycosyl hydrolase [uncultured Bacteroides sp.]